MKEKCPMCSGELRYAFAETAANCMKCNFMCDVSDLPRIARAMKAESRLKTLRELCGYLQDSSDAPIIIGQDDATRTWHINYAANYKEIAWGDTFGEMIDNASKTLIEK